jgi:hypothetical protein
VAIADPFYVLWLKGIKEQRGKSIENGLLPVSRMGYSILGRRHCHLS